MNISKSRLKQIIKEELANIIKEEEEEGKKYISKQLPSGKRYKVPAPPNATTTSPRGYRTGRVGRTTGKEIDLPAGMTSTTADTPETAALRKRVAARAPEQGVEQWPSWIDTGVKKLGGAVRDVAGGIMGASEKAAEKKAAADVKLRDPNWVMAGGDQDSWWNYGQKDPSPTKKTSARAELRDAKKQWKEARKAMGPNWKSLDKNDPRRKRARTAYRKLQAAKRAMGMKRSSAPRKMVAKPESEYRPPEPKTPAERIYRDSEEDTFADGPGGMEAADKALAARLGLKGEEKAMADLEREAWLQGVKNRDTANAMKIAKKREAGRKFRKKKKRQIAALRKLKSQLKPEDYKAVVRAFGRDLPSAEEIASFGDIGDRQNQMAQTPENP